MKPMTRKITFPCQLTGEWFNAAATRLTGLTREVCRMGMEHALDKQRELLNQ